MPERLLGYFAMTKPRAMAVVLLTAAAGYGIAVQGDVDAMLLVHLLVGTALSGGGSIVLNQVLERVHDGRMSRTAGRPLPRGLIPARHALVYGVALALIGTAWLWLFVNTITALLAGLSVVTYVLLYTPLKRITPLNTAVGAVPGAIPPMMGWTAETGTIGAEAWILFAILFVWQFPHFLAIGWLYRDDYARAGYAMLSGRDRDGSVTARQIVLNAACLMVVALLPTTFGFAGAVYAVSSVVLSLGLLAVCTAFALRRTSAMARVVLKGTVIHISVLMALLVADKI